MAEITNNRLVPQKSGSGALQKQQLERLSVLLAEFQLMTRQFSEYETAIWLRALSSCHLNEVEQGMQDFVETATGEDRRSVSLGDINRRIDAIAERRHAEFTKDENHRNRERWRAEQEADIARDPEGFERTRKEAQEKFRKMFGKSIEQASKQAATEESLKAIQAGELG